MPRYEVAAPNGETGKGFILQLDLAGFHTTPLTNNDTLFAIQVTPERKEEFLSFLLPWRERGITWAEVSVPDMRSEKNIDKDSPQNSRTRKRPRDSSAFVAFRALTPQQFEAQVRALALRMNKMQAAQHFGVSVMTLEKRLRETPETKGVEFAYTCVKHNRVWRGYEGSREFHIHIGKEHRRLEAEV